MDNDAYPIDSVNAAAYLKYSKGYLYRLVYLGKIPCYKPAGRRGKIYFKKQDLDAFVFRNRKAADYENGGETPPVAAGKIKLPTEVGRERKTWE